MALLTSSVNNEISAEVNGVLGIMENVRTSLNACVTEEDIRDYIYSVADAYTDRIPAGIYCGLCSGTYTDKMWTPDAEILTGSRIFENGLQPVSQMELIEKLVKSIPWGHNQRIMYKCKKNFKLF